MASHAVAAAVFSRTAIELTLQTRRWSSPFAGNQVFFFPPRVRSPCCANVAVGSLLLSFDHLSFGLSAAAAAMSVLDHCAAGLGV